MFFGKNKIFCSTMNFDKCHNLSKRNVKLILKILSDLEPLKRSSNKKTLYSIRSCVNWAFFGTRGPLKRSFHSRFKINYYYYKTPFCCTRFLEHDERSEECYKVSKCDKMAYKTSMIQYFSILSLF
jgi:hypothetical protein